MWCMKMCWTMTMMKMICLISFNSLAWLIRCLFCSLCSVSLSLGLFYGCFSLLCLYSSCYKRRFYFNEWHLQKINLCSICYSFFITEVNLNWKRNIMKIDFYSCMDIYWLLNTLQIQTSENNLFVKDKCKLEISWSLVTGRRLKHQWTHDKLAIGSLNSNTTNGPLN